MKVVIKVGALVLGFWFAGYGAGTWYAKRKADETWTLSAVRRHVVLNHQARSAPHELVFACGDDEAAYDVASGAISHRPITADRVTSDLFPKLSEKEAFFTATFFTGLRTLDGLPEMVRPLQTKVHWAAALAGGAFGFYIGWKHHREVTPDCDRKSVQAVLADAGFWKDVVVVRERVAARERGLRPLPRLTGLPAGVVVGDRLAPQAN